MGRSRSYKPPQPIQRCEIITWHSHAIRLASVASSALRGPFWSETEYANCRSAQDEKSKRIHTATTGKKVVAFEGLLRQSSKPLARTLLSFLFFCVFLLFWFGCAFKKQHKTQGKSSNKQETGLAREDPTVANGRMTLWRLWPQFCYYIARRRKTAFLATTRATFPQYFSLRPVSVMV